MVIHIVCLNSNVTKVYLKKLLVKSSKNKFIFLPAFYLNLWLMKLPKNFEKRAILKIGDLVSFWGVKITSVRNKFNFSVKYWFMESNIVFFTCHGSEKGSKYHLETVQTTFSENNNYYRAIFVKIISFHTWKGVKYRSNFWHLIENHLLYFLNGYFIKTL